VLFSSTEIQQKIRELAQEIVADYRSRYPLDVTKAVHSSSALVTASAECGPADPVPLVAICILKGAVSFFTALVQAIGVLDPAIPLVLDFMAVSSYGSKSKSSGTVRIIMDARVDLGGKHVIVVEDIVDSGRTAQYLLSLLRPRNPACLQMAVLLKKTASHQVAVTVDYVGFECPPAFVVGFGLDYAEFGRHFPFVGVIRPSAIRSKQ